MVELHELLAPVHATPARTQPIDGERDVVSKVAGIAGTPPGPTSDPARFRFAVTGKPGRGLLRLASAELKEKAGRRLHAPVWGLRVSVEAAAPPETWAVTYVDNHRSAAVCPRIGMRLLGITYRRYHDPHLKFWAGSTPDPGPSLSPDEPPPIEPSEALPANTRPALLAAEQSAVSSPFGKWLAECGSHRPGSRSRDAAAVVGPRPGSALAIAGGWHGARQAAHCRRPPSAAVGGAPCAPLGRGATPSPLSTHPRPAPDRRSRGRSGACGGPRRPAG
jgi:hypothetical protein